ncbi:hypothetical protein HS088_TW13G00318 [Tripterygium wilfordii]|uniref:Uncharacterized protein n=1 Tax=Tripterygium wilfordii TaxID=458696 RepID=A0A7J7CTW8_TRIWF|nr:uncharacterized protein LOC120013079 [Tripterygium wilfordii]KAF5737438.1 hypothetical protein HS088_TW13G00318 [Tripterygium wilfordii]
MEPKSRAVGGTEHSWCSAVPGGTGIAVLAILTSKVSELLPLQNALQKLQHSHPILMSRLLYNPALNTASPFSFITSPNAFIQLKTFDLASTSDILEHCRLNADPETEPISPFHVIMEHELNLNSWCSSTDISSKSDLFYATNYALEDGKWVLVLRLHVSACDRTTAVSLLKELLMLASGEEGGGGGVEKEMCSKEEVGLGIESLIPNGLAKKALWARGMNMVGYSVDSLRLSNLKFNDVKSPRYSQVVRLQMDQFETERLVTGCKDRGIKLCGALVAAGLIAAHSSRSHKYYKQKKYGVVTLTDCRSILEPPLSSHNFGFYHAAIMNTHVMKGTEKLWELATKAYMSMANSKKSNKHFSDMADLNFLMRKAVESPGLTAASSLRTSVISVFEDTVVDDTRKTLKEAVGLEDYMGCSSVHGIGPSIALFDTIRDGRLDCVCVYPAPLHSREQMVELVGNMKRVLVEGCNDVVV